MALISLNQEKEIGKIPYNDLKPELCELVNGLFTLLGKFTDDDKIKLWGQTLAVELPKKFPYLKLSHVEQIFKNAITGDFGPLKGLDLPTLFGWVGKWLESTDLGQRINFEPLAASQTSSLSHVNWSKEVYKAYQRYLKTGLELHTFSQFIYDRMLMDGLLEPEAYREYIIQASEIIKDNPDNFCPYQIEIAKKMAVLNRFRHFQIDGFAEIYKSHKNDP